MSGLYAMHHTRRGSCTRSQRLEYIRNARRRSINPLQDHSALQVLPDSVCTVSLCSQFVQSMSGLYAMHNTRRGSCSRSQLLEYIRNARRRSINPQDHSELQVLLDSVCTVSLYSQFVQSVCTKYERSERYAQHTEGVV